MTTLTPTAPRNQVRRLNLGAVLPPDIDKIGNDIKDYSDRNDVPKLTRPSEEKAQSQPSAPTPVEPQPAPAPTPTRTRKAGSLRTKSRAAEMERPSMRRLTAELPDYLVDALFDKAHEMTRAAKQGTVTVRFLLIKALHKDGYHVEPEDLLEDRRRDY